MEVNDVRREGKTTAGENEIIRSKSAVGEKLGCGKVCSLVHYKTLVQVFTT